MQSHTIKFVPVEFVPFEFVCAAGLFEEPEDEECRVPPTAPPMTAAATTMAKTTPKIIQKFRRRTPQILRTLGAGGQPADLSGRIGTGVPRSTLPVELGELGEVGDISTTACFSPRMSSSLSESS